MGDMTMGIVLDIGSHKSRAGFAGEDGPRTELPSVIGEPKQKKTMVGMGSRELFFGEEAMIRRGLLKTRSVVKNGLIANFDDWEMLVTQILHNELRVAPEEHAVLFSAPIQSPLMNEQKQAQILFETLGVPALAGVRSPALSLYASGRGSGIVVDIGHGLTQIVPIIQGVVIYEAIISSNVAGGAITDYLATSLTERSKLFSSPSSANMLFNFDEIKRSHCYVALNFEEEMLDYRSSMRNVSSWTFPDGGVYNLADERIRAPEVLFKPKFGGYEMLSISQLIFKSIMKCPMDIRRDLYTNIILSGGTTLTRGFPERIEAEVRALIPNAMVCKVAAPPERAYSTWIGGSIAGSLSTWQSRLFTKEAYDEVGPSEIHRYGNLATHISQPLAYTLPDYVPYSLRQN